MTTMNSVERAIKATERPLRPAREIQRAIERFRVRDNLLQEALDRAQPFKKLFEQQNQFQRLMDQAVSPARHIVKMATQGPMHRMMDTIGISSKDVALALRDPLPWTPPQPRDPLAEQTETIARALIAQIENAEKDLDDGHELGVLVGSHAGALYVDCVEFAAPGLLIFHGATRDKVKARLLHHVTQAHLMLLTLKKRGKTAVRIGFRIGGFRADEKMH